MISTPTVVPLSSEYEHTPLDPEVQHEVFGKIDAMHEEREALDDEILALPKGDERLQALRAQRETLSQELKKVRAMADLSNLPVGTTISFVISEGWNGSRRIQGEIIDMTAKTYKVAYRKNDWSDPEIKRVPRDPEQTGIGFKSINVLYGPALTAKYEVARLARLQANRDEAQQREQVRRREEERRRVIGAKQQTFNDVRRMVIDTLLARHRDEFEMMMQAGLTVASNDLPNRNDEIEG